MKNKFLYPYYYKKKYFGGYVIGLNKLIQFWFNEYGIVINLNKKSIFKWINIEIDFRPFKIKIYKENY